VTAHVSGELRRQVRQDAGSRCGYCLSAEQLTGSPLTIDHIVPTGAGGPTSRDNLWLACHRCNEFKSDRQDALDLDSNERVPIYNPRTQNWREHFAWSPDGTSIRGLTAIGRATVIALQLNNDYIIQARRFWVEAGRHPPGR
jgi:HNH endonuclease